MINSSDMNVSELRERFDRQRSRNNARGIAYRSRKKSAGMVKISTYVAVENVESFRIMVSKFQDDRKRKLSRPVESSGQWNMPEQAAG